MRALRRNDAGGCGPYALPSAGGWRLIGSLFLSGQLPAPWRRNADGSLKPRHELTPQEKERQGLWDEANELALEEQLYLIARHTSHDEDWALAQSVERRMLWLVRVLRDLKFEAERHAQVINTMIKLWGEEG